MVKLNFLLAVVLAGCPMSAEQIVAAKVVCARAGMGVTWLYELGTNRIVGSQCNPSEHVEVV